MLVCSESENMSKWNDMPTSWLLFQWASTIIKIQVSMSLLYTRIQKADILLLQSQRLVSIIHQIFFCYKVKDWCLSYTRYSSGSATKSKIGVYHTPDIFLALLQSLRLVSIIHQIFFCYKVKDWCLSYTRYLQ
jgi:hypothetical protein